MQTATMTAPVMEITPPIKTVRVIPAKAEFTQAEGKPKILRAAAYCRVSTDKDEQEKSYQAQCDYYTDKIMSNPEMRMAGIYADEGISGTQASKRPQFMKMISDCKKGKIDIILTKSIQRFARNTLDSLEYVRLLKSMGIGVIFETQGLDTRKMTNEFLLTIYASMAQNESENISANVKWGWHKSFKKGKVAFSYKNFLGYRRGEDGTPEIDPDQAIVVWQIYTDFLAGHSLKQIASDLTADGIPTVKGNEVWKQATVASILKNEKYKGDAILQKTFVADCLSHTTKVNAGELPQFYVTDNHPAIIDKGTWNRVSEELARRGGKRKVKEVGTTTEQGKYSSKFALTELLVCGCCGKPYRRVTWSRNGQKKIVWRCISRLDYGTKYCADSPTLEESVMQTAVLDALIEQARMIPAALEVLKQNLGMTLTDGNDADGDPYALQARLGELDTQLDGLIALAAKEDGDGEYDDQIGEICAERKELKEKLAQIRAAGDHALAERSRLDEVFTITDGLRNHPIDWNEQIIRQHLEYVRVQGKDRLAVKFRYGGEVEMPLG